jgi:hypothetical protein
MKGPFFSACAVRSSAGGLTRTCFHLVETFAEPLQLGMHRSDLGQVG